MREKSVKRVRKQRFSKNNDNVPVAGGESFVREANSPERAALRTFITGNGVGTCGTGASRPFPGATCPDFSAISLSSIVHNLQYILKYSMNSSLLYNFCPSVRF